MKPLRFTLLFSAVLALTATAYSNAAQADENLIHNPGFEKQKLEWGVFIPSNYKSEVVSFYADNAEPHAGQTCMTVDAQNPIRYALAPRKKIRVEPGVEYTVSAWVKFGEGTHLQVGKPAAYVRVTLYKTYREATTDPLGHMHLGLDGTFARSPEMKKLAPAALPNGWVHIEGTVKIPDDITFVALNLFVEGVSGPVYWDDVNFAPVSPKE